MARIGEQLLLPEKEWKRFKFANNDYMNYSDNWELLSDENGVYFEGKNERISTKENNKKVTFKFTGSEIRIISSLSDSYSNKVEIQIDSNKENFSLKGELTKGVLVYEKTDLPYKEHTVTITNLDQGHYCVLDCLDIDGTGSLETNIQIGDQLLKPSLGWKRIDDTDEAFKFVGKWTSSTNGYKNTNKCISTNEDSENSYIEFYFFGTKLRVIQTKNSEYSKSCTYEIDGKSAGTCDLSNNVSVSQILSFEKINLNKKIHHVKIYSNDGLKFDFDAIDIDDNGCIIKKTLVGELYSEPDNGWVRFDDTDYNIGYSRGWNDLKDENSYGKSFKFTEVKGDILSFNFYGDSFRIIANTSNEYPQDKTFEIRDKNSVLGTCSLYSEVKQNQVLIFEHTFEFKDVHEITIENKGSKLNFDAIEIGPGGALLPVLMTDYEFPIGVIEENDVIGYAASLINGEEQLLITPDKGKLFLTNGRGGFIKCGNQEETEEKEITSNTIKYNKNKCSNVEEALDKMFEYMETNKLPLIESLNKINNI